MDPNPSRNRKLTPAEAPVEEAPQKAPESAPEAPVKVAGSTPTYRIQDFNHLSYTSGGVATITMNSGIYPGSVITTSTLNAYPPKPNFEALAAREQYTSWEVNISGYAMINGQLYTKTVKTDRFLWDTLTPHVRDMQVQKLKRELAVDIVEKLIEVYVDGHPWNPPADQKAP